MFPSTCILGVSCGFHDSSAALVSSTGQVLFASSEERFSRVKGDRSFPWSAVNFAIDLSKKNNYVISKIILHESPYEKFKLSPSKSIFGYLKHLKNSFLNLRQLHCDINKLITVLDIDDCNVLYSDHHLSHAYASISSSQSEKGLVLVLDAIGGCSSGLAGVYSNGRIVEYEHIPLVKSLGLIYSSITVYCGFKVLTGEYKLMGLAPYGKPIYYNLLVQVFGLPTFNSYNIGDLNVYSDSLISKKLSKILPFRPRLSENDLLNYNYADLAASIQLYLENCISSIIDTYYSKYSLDASYSLSLSGGVALNCKANMSIADKYQDYFSKVWAFPASGDAGSSIGCCMQYLSGQFSISSCKFNQMLLGPSPHQTLSNNSTLTDFGFKELSDTELHRICSNLREGKVGAICSSYSEFGPRALGNRSIIADATNANSLSFINRNIKQREDFRPLAPVILKNCVSDYYELNSLSEDMYSYMLTLACYKNFSPMYMQPTDKNSSILPFVDSSIDLSSVVHVDGTSRIQVVDPDDTKPLSKILVMFNTLFSIPVLINTSLNVRGEPIVQSIDDAISCFRECELDFIVIDNQVVFRADIPSYLLFKTGITFTPD